MTDLETLLADRLEARADRVPVGPAPVHLMVRRASARRRRPVVVLAAAAAVAAVAVGLAVVVPGSESGEPPPAGPTTHGARTIGEGRVVVDIPAEITDERASVQVLVGVDRDRSPIPAFRGGVDDVVIDGAPAVRYPAACDQSQQECSTWVAVPGEDTVVVVHSHVGAGLAHDLAGRVRVLPEAGVATKRVGVGHLSVEVPESWSHNDLHCTTPQSDGYVDQTAFKMCAAPRLAGIESVRVITVEPSRDGQEAEVDGERVRWVDPSCGLSDPLNCVASVWMPSRGIGLVIESSTGLAEVEAILASVTYDRSSVAVPRAVTEAGVPISQEEYARRLRAAGLVPAPRRSTLPTDLRVSEVVPYSGTMVPVGSAVEFGVERWTDSDKGSF